jgi:hypothetical protein
MKNLFDRAIREIGKASFSAIRKRRSAKARSLTLPSAPHPDASQLLPRDCSSQALLRPHNDGSLHYNQKRGLSMSSRLSPTHSKLPPKWAIPSLELSAQRDLDNARVSSTPSRGRTLFRFVIAFCLGVTATLGWQSYGAREMIANWAEQFGWLGPAPDAHASSIVPPTAVVATSPGGEEQAVKQDVFQKISGPLPKSPAAPTPSQVVGPVSDTFIGAIAWPK